MTSPLLTVLTAAVALVASGAAADLPPSCDRRVYCHSELLHHVQIKEVFPDSKTFVDRRLLETENATLAAFDVLLRSTGGEPSRDQLAKFVDEHFAEGGELEDWTPPDFTEEPLFLDVVMDETYKQFGRDVNKIWPTLGRKVKDAVTQNPEMYSLIPLPNGFIIPGGRFKEIYYWDSYWIIEGLIVCGMTDTARGMIENLIELVRKLGHVPNGSRVYYNERSQPPLLAAMAQLYVKATGDITWLRRNISPMEDEIQYWLDGQTVNVRGHRLLQYNAPSEGPRPESYLEDYRMANEAFNGSEQRRRDFYIDIKSAAESGWDFSSRWFIDSQGGNTGSLQNVKTRRIVPVDLNAIFAGALKTLGNFRAQLGNRLSAFKWRALGAAWRKGIDAVLWNDEEGVWFDYDLGLDRHRKYFYPSNVAPLWAGAVDRWRVKLYAPRVARYLTSSKGLSYPGGVPTSLANTGEQWDFPNAWPPLESIVIGALEAGGDKEGHRLAVQLANVWVRSNYLSFNATRHMYEKYNAEKPGVEGAGGEYEVQLGFGWSNGVVMELLGKYGSELAFADKLEDSLEKDSEDRSSDRRKSSPEDSFE